MGRLSLDRANSRRACDRLLARSQPCPPYPNSTSRGALRLVPSLRSGADLAGMVDANDRDQTAVVVGLTARRWVRPPRGRRDRRRTRAAATRACRWDGRARRRKSRLGRRKPSRASQMRGSRARTRAMVSSGSRNVRYVAHIISPKPGILSTGRIPAWSRMPPRIAHRRVGRNQSQNASANSISRAPCVIRLTRIGYAPSHSRFEPVEFAVEQDVMHRRAVHPGRAAALDHARLEVDRGRPASGAAVRPTGRSTARRASRAASPRASRRANTPPRSGRASCRSRGCNGTASGPPLDERLRW